MSRPAMHPQTLQVPTDLVERVADAEFARLLGYPGQRIPQNRIGRRAAECRAWYEEHGRPLAVVRALRIDRIEEPGTSLSNGETFNSHLLAQRLRQADSAVIVVAAVSAGSAVDERSGALWLEGRLDEGYCLDRFGAAVAEQLATWTARSIRAGARDDGLAALPGYSPGYDGWDLADQVTVARCLLPDGAYPPPAPFAVLSSGMISPTNSLLTVFALTPNARLADSMRRRHRCSWCALARCDLRRARFAGRDGAT